MSVSNEGLDGSKRKLESIITTFTIKPVGFKKDSEEEFQLPSGDMGKAVIYKGELPFKKILFIKHTSEELK